MAQPVVARAIRVALAAKIEAAYGTPEALVGADIIAARNPSWRAIVEQYRDERVSGLMEQYPDVPGARSKQLTFSTLARGAGAVYSASVKPELDAIWRASGYSAVGSFTGGSEKWTYEPQLGGTMGESLTAAIFSENAPQGKLAGAFGTGRLIFRSGQPLEVQSTLSGLYDTDPGDVALISQAMSPVTPPTFSNAAVTIDGQVLHVSGMELDLGVEVTGIPSANPAAAVEGFLIANRRITLTLDPRQVTVATYNFFTKLTVGNRVVATWDVKGGAGAQYNRIKFTANQFQFSEITEVTRNGLKAFQITALLAGGTSPMLSIVYD